MEAPFFHSNCRNLAFKIRTQHLPTAGNVPYLVKLSGRSTLDRLPATRVYQSRNPARNPSRRDLPKRRFPSAGTARSRAKVNEKLPQQVGRGATSPSKIPCVTVSPHRAQAFDNHSTLALNWTRFPERTHFVYTLSVVSTSHVHTTEIMNSNRFRITCRASYPRLNDIERRNSVQFGMKRIVLQEAFAFGYDRADHFLC